MFYFSHPHIHSTATLREISCTACAANADGQVCVSNDFLPRFRDLFLFDVCTQLELAFWVARLGSWPLLSFPGAQSSDGFAAQVVSTSRPTPARLSSNPEVAFKSPTSTAFLFSHRSVLSLVPQECCIQPELEVHEYLSLSPKRPLFFLSCLSHPWLGHHACYFFPSF